MKGSSRRLFGVSLGFWLWRAGDLAFATALGLAGGLFLTWLARDWAGRLLRPELEPRPEYLALACFLAGLGFLLALQQGFRLLGWLERRSERRASARRSGALTAAADSGPSVGPEAAAAGSGPAAAAEQD